jgi:hypothetical protein
MTHAAQLRPVMYFRYGAIGILHGLEAVVVPPQLVFTHAGSMHIMATVTLCTQDSSFPRCQQTAVMTVCSDSIIANQYPANKSGKSGLFCRMTPYACRTFADRGCQKMLTEPSESLQGVVSEEPKAVCDPTVKLPREGRYLQERDGGSQGREASAETAQT